ncbi:hypothetical protein [Alloprevotella tannerae]|uniref:hypothetical protein n=1 Tax=Alloprevotella tannerae TaxID=76122 RepID=UPI0028E1B68E|nr:hypothetical protein [Alloprevotella tannerae]
MFPLRRRAAAAQPFFVCRQQTIVWWEQTIVWWQHTIVWRQQTMGRWVRRLRWPIVAQLLYYGLRIGVGRRQPLPHRPRSRACTSATTRGAKGRKGLTGKRNTAATAFLAQLLPPQTSEACD